MDLKNKSLLFANSKDIKNNKQIYELIENREIQKIIFL